MLEICCIFLIARTNNLQGNDIMSSANAVTGWVAEKNKNIVYYFSLKEVNDSLLNENKQLQLRLAQETRSYDMIKDSMVAHTTRNHDTTKIIQYAAYVYRSAKVLKNTVTNSNNFITLNRGRRHGIEKNMAVVSANGVVGRVLYVSENFAAVLSVLNVKQKISAELKDGTIGSVMWEGNPDRLIMEDIPQQIPVKKGDSIFTTSYSFFPENILIGRIIERKIIQKNNLQRIYIQPATNFRRLKYVYVVENQKMDERRALEDSTIMK